MFVRWPILVEVDVVVVVVCSISKKLDPGPVSRVQTYGNRGNINISIEIPPYSSYRPTRNRAGLSI